MYRIIAGDYERVGAAASELKGMLKRAGAEPTAVRRAMIAAYEAEANVAIHSRGGEMRVTLDEGVLDVEVVDAGPGIPDIEAAMREGYSTAPAAARELGFGAGMGLPNIKRNSDRFELHSAPGSGTRLCFRIYLAPQAAGGRAPLWLRLDASRCTGCLRCLRACPTEALRVRGGRPQVLEHLCFGCGACIAACPAGALAPEGADATLDRIAGTTLIVPAALLAQFGARRSPERVLAALAALGVAQVWVSEGWEPALREAVAAYAREEGRPWPVLSPVCPAVVSLVEMRFPSLISHLAPFASPVEAAASEAAGRDAAVAAGCPAQCSVLAASRGRLRGILASSLLVQAIPRQAAEGGQGDTPPSDRPPQEAGRPAGILRIAGARRVIAALEEAENGLLTDVPVLELSACEEGCFGSPLLREEPAVARWRWAAARGAERPGARAVRRDRPFTARRGLRLDEDMGRAIAKLAEMDRLLRELPARDCGLCGAPTCRALAEDIVLGRAEVAACPQRRRDKENPR